MDNHSLLQGIFSTQGSKLALLHFRQTLHRLSQQEAQKDFEGQPDSGPQASVSVGEREDLDMVISEVASTSDLCMTTLLGHARGMRAELTFGARSWFWAPQPTPHLLFLSGLSQGQGLCPSLIPTLPGSGPLLRSSESGLRGGKLTRSLGPYPGAWVP